MTISRTTFLSRNCCSLPLVAMCTHGMLRTAAAGSICICPLTKHLWLVTTSSGNLRLPLRSEKEAFEELKYTPRASAHNAGPRGELTQCCGHRRRGNFSRRHVDSCEMTRAQIAKLSRGIGWWWQLRLTRSGAPSQRGGTVLRRTESPKNALQALQRASAASSKV